MQQSFNWWWTAYSFDLVNLQFSSGRRRQQAMMVYVEDIARLRQAETLIRRWRQKYRRNSEIYQPLSQLNSSDAPPLNSSTKLSVV
jgi:hypothetical protein